MKPTGWMLMLPLALSASFTWAQPVQHVVLPAIASDSVPDRIIKPGIYGSMEDVLRHRPKLTGVLLVDPAGNTHVPDLHYVDSRGRYRTMPGKAVYGYSDGAFMYLRRPNPLRPNRVDGYLRVEVFAHLMVGRIPAVDPSRSTLLAPAHMDAEEDFSSPPVSQPPPVNLPNDPRSEPPRQPHFYFLHNRFVASPSSTFIRQADQWPTNAPDRQFQRSRAALQGVRADSTLFLIDAKTGRVTPLDALYLPAILLERDPGLYQQWVLDTRANHSQLKLLDFVRRFNIRNPIPNQTLASQ